MWSTRIQWVLRNGASMALLMALSTLGAASPFGGGDVVLAQGTGQPDTTQPDDAPGPVPASSPTPVTSPQTPPAPGQQGASQPRTPGATILDLVVGGETTPSGVQETNSIDEGDDIDEGLSNQRFDPDD